jgi:hypothetical protein
MGLLTFSINVTLDGCVDHQEEEQGSVCTFSRRMVTSADKEDVAS